MNAEQALIALMAAEARDRAQAAQHIDVRKTRFHAMREYLPEDTLKLGFVAACLETWSATRQEILSDPSGELHLRLAKLFGRGDAAAESFLRRLKENTSIDGVLLYFTTASAIECVEKVFADASLDAIRVDAKSRAPTLMLMFPSAIVNKMGAEISLAGMKLAVRKGWELLASWYKAKEPDAERFIAEFDLRYNDPALEIWMRLIPYTRVPPFLTKRWLWPRVVLPSKRAPEPQGDEETEDAEDEDDHEPQASVVVPLPSHAEEEKK